MNWLHICCYGLICCIVLMFHQTGLTLSTISKKFHLFLTLLSMKLSPFTSSIEKFVWDGFLAGLVINIKKCMASSCWENKTAACNYGKALCYIVTTQLVIAIIQLLLSNPHWMKVSSKGFLINLLLFILQIIYFSAIVYNPLLVWTILDSIFFVFALMTIY